MEKFSKTPTVTPHIKVSDRQSFPHYIRVSRYDYVFYVFFFFHFFKYLDFNVFDFCQLSNDAGLAFVCAFIYYGNM